VCPVETRNGSTRYAFLGDPADAGRTIPIEPAGALRLAIGVIRAALVAARSSGEMGQQARAWLHSIGIDPQRAQQQVIRRDHGTG
jgi:hypothetical protein